MIFSPKNRAFTLIELLVAITITVLMIMLLATIASSTTGAWQRGANQAETFSSARGSLALLSRELQGAVVDPDLGYVVQPVQGSPNNFILKFISRRIPAGTTTAAVEKVAYQLAWADTGLVPEVTATSDTKHPIPVLIRTSNFSASATMTNSLNDVFKITTTPAKFPWQWVRSWGTIPASGVIQTGQQDTKTGDVTEVVAENVLGWWVYPLYWDSATGKKKMVIDDPTLATNRYYDNTQTNANPTAAKPPKYITSDLKYVKKSDSTLTNITTDTAPRAIEIRLLVVPSSAVPRMKDLAGWSTVRQTTGLYNFLALTPDTPFNNLLKQRAQAFDGTCYLSSRTP